MAVTYNADGTMYTTYSSSSEVGSYTLTGSTLTAVLTSTRFPLLPSRTLASTVKELTAIRLVLESPREDIGYRYIDTHTFAHLRTLTLGFAANTLIHPFAIVWPNGPNRLKER